MKVLYLIDTLQVGGAEQSLQAILSRFNYMQPVVCHVYPGDTLKPKFEAANIPVISLNIQHKYGFREAISQILALLKTVKPDLLHTTLFRADIAGRIAGKLAGVPVISSFVNESYHPTRWQSLSLAGRFKLKGVQEMDRLTARWTNHFMAVSEATRMANCQALNIDPEQVSVIYRGRDPELFLEVSQYQIDKLRIELVLPANGLVLLNVARLLNRKGQAELIQAMPLVLKEFPMARLLIAGEGHDRSKLEATIQSLNLNGVVQLLGTRADIPQLLHLADIFVFPSHYEGYPGALIEAMFAARPIVASDIPVHRETISHGETGLLAPLQSSKLLAQCIIQLLQDRESARKMGQSIQASSMKRFHIAHVAAQHEAMYEAIRAKSYPPKRF